MKAIQFLLASSMLSSIAIATNSTTDDNVYAIDFNSTTDDNVYVRDVNSMTDDDIPISDFNITGPIPDVSVICTGEKINQMDIMYARAKSYDFCKRGRKLGHGEVRVFSHMSSMWAICNCQHFTKVPCPQAELDHAAALINANCGEEQSGKMWSSKWNKMWIRDATKLMWNAGDPCSICPTACCSNF
ncbi:hypothetical protein F4777DRAFT_598535 [Nemania sp. FL0916]|nr:hypothetical protein F4777DRAFT_598535 [Nemania sp. FL0916]